VNKTVGAQDLSQQQGENVKKTYRGFGVVAALTAAALTLTGCAVPEDEAVVTPTPTETEEAALAPLVTVAWNDLIDEFNSSSVTGNNTANAIITYMTSSGFNYYNNEPALVQNTDFGTYEKVSDTPLTVKYTINDGVVWSDGTDIDGADLLLSWVAVFGYGNSEGEEGPVFPFNHANPKPQLASKLPTVEGRSITFEYDVQYVDWELQFGLGVAAHGTVQMAYPDLSAADAKSQFIAAVQAGDWDFLNPVAEQWTVGYKSVNTPSNPLVLLSSGPYIVEELVEDSYVTLVINDKYTWGDKPKYERITVRQIADSTAAVQAVENGEVDIASGQPTPDVLALVEALANANFVTGDDATYEHIDLSFANGGPFDPASYGGDADKARAVRQAFLLTIPREEIVDKLIKPLNPNAGIRNSFLNIPGSPNYDNIVANNGSAFFSEGDMDSRIAKAKQLLADNGVSTPIDVKFWYPEGNVRRGQEFELIQLSAAKAGFNVIDDSEPTWAWIGVAPHPHDAVIFGWQSTSLAVTGSDQIFSTGKPSNFNAYSNATVDALLTELDTTLDPARQAAIQLAVEQELWNDAYGTTIFQFPGLTWWNSAVTGVAPSPLSPTLFWNFWQWGPVAG
jgi:peptide/nickel transport system substrate-binding protein